MVNNFKILVDLESKSLRQIHKELNISYSTLRLYYKGSRKPRGKIAEKLAEYFEVSSEVFSSTAPVEGQPASIKNHIPEILKQSQQTMADISRGTGIPYDSIYQYVKGETRPRYDNLQKLSDYLGIPITDLIEVKKASYSFERKHEIPIDRTHKENHKKQVKRKSKTVTTFDLPSISVELPDVYLKAVVANLTDQMLTQLEKALEDKELYKPMVRMAGLCRWLDVSTTTIVKWQKEGMPHMVIDGVTLYDKHKVAEWLQQFEK